MRTQAEWNVLTHIFRATGPTSATTRSRISSAALLVNVMARIRIGIDAVLADQVGDAVGEDAGLAGAGAGDDQQGALGVDHRIELVGVQPRQSRRSTGMEPILRVGCAVGLPGHR